MANPLTLARVWRILKEVDLTRIRQEADARQHLLVIGETTGDADELALLLAGGEPDPVPWLTAIDAPLAADPPTRTAARDAAWQEPHLVIAITRGTRASDAMQSARRSWGARGIPLVTVALDTDEPSDRPCTRGAASRVAVPRLAPEHLPGIVDAIVAVIDPSRRVPLARQFAALRSKVFNVIIDETARANAGYAFTTGLAEAIPLLDIPLNVGDMIVLTKNQLMMSYRLALAAGKQGHARALIGEIVGVLGGGLLLRQLARQLVGLVPVIGIVPKVAVAYGGTWAIGRAVALWATEGRRLTARRLKDLSREGLARGREVARSIGRSRPS